MASPQPPPRPRQPTRDAAPSPLPAALRMSSERYLRGHPETRLLLRGFLRELLHQRPDDVLEFAAGYFTQPDLPRRIREQLGGAGSSILSGGLAPIKALRPPHPTCPPRP